MEKVAYKMGTDLRALGIAFENIGHNIKTRLKSSPCDAETLSEPLLSMGKILSARAIDSNGTSAEIAITALSALRGLTGRIVEAEMRAREAEKRLEEMQRLAAIDPLTGLWNRWGLEKNCQRVMYEVKRYNGSAALVYIDLDNFKPINDIYGHAMGDAALQFTAKILKQNIRNEDVVARIGGDEFVILFHNDDPDHDFAVELNRLRNAFKELDFIHDGKVLSLRASVGLEKLNFEDDAREILRRADEKMFAEKRQKSILNKAQGTRH